MIYSTPTQLQRTELYLLLLFKGFFTSLRILLSSIFIVGKAGVSIQKMHFFTLSGSLIALLYLQQSTAIELDVNNQNSLQNAAKAIAGNIITTYNITNENDIGTSADTSSWWTTGAALDALVKYWFLSGDSQYNDQVSASLLIQQGPNFDYMPPNQTRTEVSWELPSQDLVNFSH